MRNIRFPGSKPLLPRSIEHTLGYSPALCSLDTDVRARSEVPTVVTVRYFAAARAAAGLPSEDVDVGDGATVADALEAIATRPVSYTHLTLPTKRIV